MSYSNYNRNEVNASISPKWLKIGIGSAVCLILAIWTTYQFAHKLENQNLAIVQSVDGEVSVRRQAGWWIQPWPTITEYPKAGIYRLNAQDRDTLDIQFKNKSTAKLNVNIGYRIDNADDSVIIALHQQVEGKDDKIWAMLLTALNTMAQSVTTKYDPSDVIGGDKFESMIKEMYTSIMHNEELLTHGIDVNYFAVDGRPIPDSETKAQFDKQREADLARRLAEAEKIKFESERIKVQSEYAKKMAEQEGIAKAQMAKEVQDAERQKKLAEIEAQKLVEVEKLAKEKLLVQMNKEKEAAEVEVQKQKAVALVEAQKIKEVAQIQKETEAANLEKEKLIAEQVKVAALAKKEQIEKSGAITESERVKLEFDMKTKIGVAEAYSKGIAGAKLPQMWITGSGDTKNGASQNPIELLINTMTLEKLNAVSTPVTAK